MTRVRSIAPLMAAAALTAIAVLTVHSAGCDNPGRYEPRTWGYELVGGCIAASDIVVPAPVPAAPGPDLNIPARG